MTDINGNPVNAAGDDGDSMFSSIDTSDPYCVTFILSDGTTSITVPRTASTIAIEQTSANTFTFTSALVAENSGNIVSIRVESPNADGSDITTRAVADTRWEIESSVEGTTMTIVANPARTCELYETALLKVSIYSESGATLASGLKVFTNSIATTAEALEKALGGSSGYVALGNDMEIDNTVYISSDKEIDLNGHTLKSLKDGQTIFMITEGNVSFYNGTIELHNTYAAGNKSDIVVGIDRSSEKSDEVVSVATATFTNMKVYGSIYVSYGSAVEVTDSEIESELYGICTNANASDADTAPVTVTVRNTKLRGETPVFINVPASLTIDNCSITGGWQGIMMRGGNASISNSRIWLEASYAEPVEGTNWAKDRKTGQDAWNAGNEVAIAGITMGNNTASAYQYPTVVAMKNTHVHGYEGYWAVYADATEVCTVDFTYDSQCTFSPAIDPEKSFGMGMGTGNGYITVTDGKGTTTRY